MTEKRAEKAGPATMPAIGLHVYTIISRLNDNLLLYKCTRAHTNQHTNNVAMANEIVALLFHETTWLLNKQRYIYM